MQKDKIEDLAEELEIDGGDSWSQQERLRNIAAQVGMDQFNGLSNADTDELEKRLRDRKTHGNNNSYNNMGKRNNRNSLNESPKKNRYLNKSRYSTNRNNNDSNQKNDSSSETNRLGMKKSLFSEKANSNATKAKGELKFQIPTKVKIILYIVVICAIFVLMLFVAIFGSEESTGGSGLGGNLEYGENCTKVVLENTGCDTNGNNCTMIYDGEVDVETYVAGVVAAKSVNTDNLEYYKTLAISARTYFYNKVGKDCTVDGNSKFQEYIDVDDSPNSSLIKQAVSETEAQVLIQNNDLTTPKYDYGYIEKEESEYYNVGYGYVSMTAPQTQEIPKSWVEQKSLTNTLFQSKEKDYDMSTIAALYLIETNGYNHTDIINHYYGSDIQIVKNNMILEGTAGFTNPTRYINCSSPFGTRIHPVSGEQSNHTGLDIAISGGEPIYAAKDGIVRYVVNNVSAINNCDFGYGNYVIIDHEDGMSTLYAHMKYGTISDSIVAGAEIDQGDQIGEVGSTGCSTGNHLHYEVRENDKRVDPADYLNLDGATGTCRR